MKLPCGCGDMSGTIVRLDRSLHGLKQNGRPQAGLVVGTVEYGMEQCRSDPCVSHGCGRQSRTDDGRSCR